MYPMNMNDPIMGSSQNPDLPALAAMQRKTESVRMLIESHADLEARDDNGYTALMSAAKKGEGESVRLLIDARADIKARSEAGATPLILAIYQQNWGIMKLLEVPSVVDAGWGYAEEFIKRKFLAGVWGLEGRSSYIDKIGRSATIHFNLKGMNPSYARGKLGDYIWDFFASDDEMDSKMPKQYQENIRMSIACRSPVKTLSRIESGGPVIIWGGTRNHVINTVICRINNRHLLFVCNRGAGRTTNTTEFYSLSASHVNEDTIRKLKEEYPDVVSFNQMINKMVVDLKIAHTGGFSQKPQKIGNCT